jgi:RHS repeat-associated protein
VQEQSSSDAATANLLGLGVDQTFSRSVVGGATSSLLTDALGSTIALADQTGAAQTTYTYEPFGAVTQAGAANTNPFRFTGREDDGATGLYSCQARYYAPALSRFISEDPLGYPGGPDPNLYAYVGNAPTVYTDPLGLEREDGGCGVAHNITITLLVFEITLTEDDCSGLHVGQLGIGLGTPGVSSTYSLGGDPCFGLEVSYGVGPGTIGGEFGLDNDGTFGAGVDVGVGVGVDDFVPVIPDVGAFLTWGCS